jgi:iron-sulfur cluster assembly accessory protein
LEDDLNFTLTPAAEHFVRKLLRDHDGGAFRLAVVSGGCSGLAAEFGVEPKLRSGHLAMSYGDLQFFIPVASRRLLDGVIVDVVETPSESRFVFHDPKAGSCGCADHD